jgi:hypothetical protein
VYDAFVYLGLDRLLSIVKAHQERNGSQSARSPDITTRDTPRRAPGNP